MPRPALSAEDLETTRQRLLDATSRIIAGPGGYAAFSMRRLGQEVGLTAGALYRYFPTRQHVLVAYWSAGLGELNRRMAAIVEEKRAPLAELRAILLAYADFALEDRDRFRVLFIENDLGEFARLANVPDLMKGYALFVDRVDAAIAAGVLRHLPEPVAAQVLWGAVHGVLALSITVESGVEFGNVRDLAEVAVATALRGLARETNQLPAR